MITYPDKPTNITPAHTTGRIVFVDDPTKFTPEKFFSYIIEGFVPMARAVTSGSMSYTLVEHSVEVGEGATYTVKIGNATFTSADWRTPFAAA